jgi:hypothetical protein
VKKPTKAKPKRKILRSPSILDEAATIIKGQRREDYGPADQSFDAIAKTWSAILKVPVTGYQVALCMCGLKLCRASNKKTRDSLVDICGYSALAQDL